MKGEDLTVLEQTLITDSNKSQAFVLEAITLTISLKKITSEVKFSEQNSALLRNNKM